MHNFKLGDKVVVRKGQEYSNVDRVFDLRLDEVYVVDNVAPGGSLNLYGVGPFSYDDKRFEPAPAALPPPSPSHSPTGQKNDKDLPPLVQGCLAYFPAALLAVAEVSKMGAAKYAVPYSDKNWEKVPDGFNRYTDALGRHLVKEHIEGLYDNESNLLHAAHAAWDALARLELLLKNTGLRNV